MSLPEHVRVKISSESAEYMALTPVVAQDMPLRELLELMLGISGKRPERIHELLRRGALVSGASRLRWAGWDADREALDALLATFPDPDPQRPFSPTHAIHAILRGPACTIEVSREAASRRRFLARRSFWDALTEIAGAAGKPSYLEYSYKHRADSYRVELPPEAAEALRRSAGALRYSSLEARVRTAVFEAVEFYVARET